MTVTEQFNAAMIANPVLNVFIDNVTEMPNAVQYDFDGKMTCRLVERDGQFYDYCDINPDWKNPDDFYNLNVYPSVDAYVEMLVRVCCVE